MAELQYLHDLGLRRSIFLVDDNFIGNKRNAKLLLPQIRTWQEERGYTPSASPPKPRWIWPTTRK